MILSSTREKHTKEFICRCAKMPSMWIAVEKCSLIDVLDPNIASAPLTRHGVELVMCCVYVPAAGQTKLQKMLFIRVKCAQADEHKIWNSFQTWFRSVACGLRAIHFHKNTSLSRTHYETTTANEWRLQLYDEFPRVKYSYVWALCACSAYSLGQTIYRSGLGIHTDFLLLSGSLWLSLTLSASISPSASLSLPVGARSLSLCLSLSWTVAGSETADWEWPQIVKTKLFLYKHTHTHIAWKPQPKNEKRTAN